MKTVLKLIIPVIAFIVASGATYVAIRNRNAAEPVNSGKHQHDTIEGVRGLSEGEVVTLPTLTTLAGEEVDLRHSKQERLLCVSLAASVLAASRMSISGGI
jgi:hypothetical protein